MSAHSRTRARPRAAKSSTAAFEELLRRADRHAHYVLKLYITGSSPRSAQAIANVRALCDELLAGRFELEVVDIYQQPNQAADHQIIAAPTLVKSEPEPVRRLVGDFSNREKILLALNLSGSTAAKPAHTHWVEL